MQSGPASGDRKASLATLQGTLTVSSYRWRLAAPLVIALATACSSSSDSSSKVTSTVAQEDGGVESTDVQSAKSPDDIRYDNTASGLEKLMRDLQVAIVAEDEKQSTLLIASLRLTPAETWMKHAFGDELGAVLSDEYKPQREEIGLLAEVLAEQYEQGLTQVQGNRFHTPNVPAATGYQNAALEKMTSPVALYSARLYSADRSRTFHLWSFIHEGGSFRYVGKLRKVTAARASGGRDLNEYRLSDAARLSTQNED